MKLGGLAILIAFWGALTAQPALAEVAFGNAIALLARMQATGIENWWWHILSYEDGVTLRPVLGKTSASPTIKFENGELWGSLGCGGVIATYRLSAGNRMSISVFGWILAGMCGGPLDALFHENDLLSHALSRVGRVDVLGNHAVLRSGEGDALVILSAE